MSLLIIPASLYLALFRSSRDNYTASGLSWDDAQRRAREQMNSAFLCDEAILQTELERDLRDEKEGIAQ